MSSPGLPAGVVNLLCEGEREVRRFGDEITDRVRPSRFRPHLSGRPAPCRPIGGDFRIRPSGSATWPSCRPDIRPALLLASSGGHRVGLLRRSDEWRTAK